MEVPCFIDSTDRGDRPNVIVSFTRDKGERERKREREIRRLAQLFRISLWEE